MDADLGKLTWLVPTESIFLLLNAFYYFLASQDHKMFIMVREAPTA